ncbi:MAG: RNA methyltransferase [Microbacteriaceae bacterium]|nr:RNA methyltransferase [Microbacteriaceae bacterium]
MRIIPISALDDPRLADFTSLTDVALRQTLEPSGGLYLAESAKVIDRALRTGHRPRAVLTLEQWLPSLRKSLHDYPETPVFVGEPAQHESLTGFHMHRGAIASMHRPAPVDPSELLSSSRRLVVLEDLGDHTNVGAIFRSIAALGADGVLLTPSCADPLYRRAVRVSMGAVFQVPWARLPEWKQAGPMIRDAGFELVSFALDDAAEDLATFAEQSEEKLALLFGNEGQGLSRRALASSTKLVTIPMEHEVDSLNVATAAAVALWALRTADTRRLTGTSV